MKSRLILTRIFTPLALGFAFTASNGLATGIALGAAVAVAMTIHPPKPC